jgi:flavin-dependent dehydrogenase
VLVVGDAAGQVKATTSGGIYYGLLGAEAAVATANRALRTGDLTGSALGEYEADWLSRLGAEQRTGRVLRRLHAALSDRDIDMFFRLAKRAGVPGLLSRLQFDWHSSGLLTVLWRELLGRMTARPGVEAGRQN